MSSKYANCPFSPSDQPLGQVQHTGKRKGKPMRWSLGVFSTVCIRNERLEVTSSSSANQHAPL